MKDQHRDCKEFGVQENRLKKKEQNVHEREPSTRQEKRQGKRITHRKTIFVTKSKINKHGEQAYVS